MAQPATMPQETAIATQFLGTYYQQFDTNRASLAALYREDSKMTFEGQTFVGAQEITQKLLVRLIKCGPFEVKGISLWAAYFSLDPGLPTMAVKSLPFQTVQHAVTCTDCQMTVDGGLLVFVVGQLKTDNDPVHGFSQTFYLKQYGDSLFVMNDFFRLALHHQ